MAFTSDDLAAIDRAIASGELTVSHNGRTVTYRSMADLKSARALIADSLAGRGRALRPQPVAFRTLRGE